MLDKHRYDLPVEAFTDEGVVDVFVCRKDAADAIHRKRGCASNTADKEIREAIYNHNIVYGFKWRYRCTK